MRNNPVFEEIEKKQNEINEESKLIHKKEKSNPLVIVTSMILVVGTLIGLGRILMMMV